MTAIKKSEDDPDKELYEQSARVVLEEVGIPLAKGSLYEFGLLIGFLIGEAESIKISLDKPPPAERREHAKKITNLTQKLTDELNSYFNKHGKPYLYKLNSDQLIRDLLSLKLAYESEINKSEMDSRYRNKYRFFIGYLLTYEFRNHFNEEPGYTTNATEEFTDSPFVRFARVILESAGVQLKESSIGAALTGVKPPEKRRKRRAK